MDLGEVVLLDVDEEGVVVVLEPAELEEVFRGGGALGGEEVDGEVAIGGL